MKKMMTLVLVCTMVSTLWAGPVSREQARTTAQELVKASALGGNVGAMRVAAQAALADVDLPDTWGYNLYAFNVGDDEGFMILSSDDRTHPVLMYSDQGRLDLADMPIELEELLRAYSSQLDRLALVPDNDETARRNVKRKAMQWTMPAIAPMLSRHWTQSAPYNAKLPKVLNTSTGVTESDNSPSGCIPCAMSQTLGYWKWPNTIKSVPGYNSTKTESGVTYTATCDTLPATTLNWNYILDNVTTSSSSTYRNEVAKLYQYVAYSLKVNFGVHGTGGWGYDIPEALVKYFGYKNTVRYVRRSDYSLQAWSELLYSELTSGRIVVYNGSHTSGGHGFIIDGYDGESLWHINLGWGSAYDAYFDIDILNPYIVDDLPGLTVGSEGYVLNQGTCIGIEPDKDGYNDSNPLDGLLTAEVAKMSGSNASMYFKNTNVESTTNNVAWALIDDAGNIQKVYTGSSKKVTISTMTTATNNAISGTPSVSTAYLTSTLTNIASGLGLTTAGSYTVVAVGQRSGNSSNEWELLDGYQKSYITLTVTKSGSRTSYSAVAHPQATLKFVRYEVVGDLTNHEFSSGVYSRQDICVYFTNTGTDECISNIYLYNTVAPDGVDKFSYHRTTVTIQPGDTVCARMTYQFPNTGTYTFRASTTYTSGTPTSFVDGGTGCTFEITDGSSGTLARYALTAPTINNLKVVNSKSCILSSTNVSGVAKVQNTGTLVGQKFIRLYVALYAGSTMVGSEKCVLLGRPAPGQTIEIPFEFSQLNLTMDTQQYRVRFRGEYTGGTTSGGYSNDFTNNNCYSAYFYAHDPITAEACQVEGTETEGTTSYLMDLSAVGGKVTLANGDDSNQTAAFEVRLTTTANTTALASTTQQVTVKGNGTAELPFQFSDLQLQGGTAYYIRVYKGTALLASYPYTAATLFSYWDKDGNEQSYRFNPTGTTATTSEKQTGVSMTYNSGWSSSTVTGTLTTNITTTTYDIPVPEDAVAVDLTAMSNYLKTVEKTTTGTVQRSGWWNSTYSRTDTKTITTYSLGTNQNPNCLYYVAADLAVASGDALDGKNVVKGTTAPTITLTDGYDYYAPTAFTATSISYERTFQNGYQRGKGGGWQTIVLPFAATTVSTEGMGTIQWFTSQTDVEGEFWLYAMTGDDASTVYYDYVGGSTLAANHPYIIAVPDASWGQENSLVGKTLVFGATNAAIGVTTTPQQAASSHRFVGTYKAEEALSDVYLLNEAGTRFELTEGSVGAFRAWFTAQGAQSRTLQLQYLDTTTGIGLNGAETTTGRPAATYDLGGRKMGEGSGLRPGVYIKGGRKVVVK